MDLFVSDSFCFGFPTPSTWRGVMTGAPQQHTSQTPWKPQEVLGRLLGCPWKLYLVSKLVYNLFTGFTTYLYRAYNQFTNYQQDIPVGFCFCHVFVNFFGGKFQHTQSSIVEIGFVKFADSRCLFESQVGCTPFTYVYYHAMKIVFNLGILGD